MASCDWHSRHFWRGFQYHVHAIFGTQGYTRLGNHKEAGYQSRRETLENACHQQFLLHFGKRHANAHAWASAKGEVSPLRNLLPADRVPGHRAEILGGTPGVRQVVRYPLAQQYYRVGREMVAIEVERLKGAPSL